VKIILKTLHFIWRLWFALLSFFGLVVFFPLLWVLLLNKKWYPAFHSVCRMWSKFLLFWSGFFVDVEFEQDLDPTIPYLICPNHVSYLDIPVIFSIIPSVFVFVGKKSLSKLPLFGWVYKKTMILVDRSSNRSSYQAYKDASERIAQGIGITIFPEGGIPEHEVKLQRFKNGAFRMAIEQNVALVPVTFADNKRCMPSDRLEGRAGKLKVFVHKPIQAGTYTTENIHEFRDFVYKTINDKLTYYESRR
jgi:1-acyl-sn-glycerol-3-phosphate acyltransferase